MTTLARHVRAPLLDGRLVTIRPMVPEDEKAVLALHDGLSESSRYLRFFTPGRGTGQAFVHRLGEALHQPGQGVLLAELDRHVIAVACYSAVEDATVADIAFVVADSEQAHGLGTLLCEHLVSLARSRGVRTFTADVLPTNSRMLHLFRDLGLPVRLHRDGADVQIQIRLDPDDGYLDATAARETVADVASLRPLLRPASVAVVGASRREDAVGHAVLANLLASGFDGPVYAVNPKAASILGVTTHASVVDLPAVPELAIICVPAQQVPAVARQCGERGVRALAVLSAGITGESVIESELRAAVSDHGMRMVGPNCLGIASLTTGYALNATFARRVTKPGKVGVVSQSGGVGIALLEQLDRIGLGISTFVSTGDKYDVSSNDLLMWWDADPDTAIAVLYLESFGNPRKFARVARHLGQTKPVLAVRSGTSDVARRAAASHTAAAATPAVTRDALFRQAGVIAVDGLTDLVGAAAVLTCQPLPASPRVAVVSNAGGAGVLAADACATSGLVMAALAPETVAALAALVPTTASLANPVDTTAAVAADTFRDCLLAVLDDPGIDGVIAISAPTALGDLGPAIIEAAGSTSKPVVAVRLDQGEAVDLVDGVPAFADPHVAVAAYARAAEYAAWRRAPRGQVPDLPGIDIVAGRSVLAGALLRSPDGGWLEPGEADELLSAFGVPFAHSEHAATGDEAAAAAARIGGPVAMKAVVPGLLHKSDRGGVALGLDGAGQVAAAFRLMRERFGVELQHVVVQPMVRPGVETLVGVVSDATFGPLVVFGAGGVVTDLLGDRVSCLAPVSDVDAAAMVRGLKSSPLLFGFRGAALADTGAVEDVLLRVGRLAELLPEVAELELNPLVVHEKGALAVDVRIKVVPREGADPYLRRVR